MPIAHPSRRQFCHHVPLIRDAPGLRSLFVVVPRPLRRAHPRRGKGEGLQSAIGQTARRELHRRQTRQRTAQAVACHADGLLR